MKNLILYWIFQIASFVVGIVSKLSDWRHKKRNCAIPFTETIKDIVAELIGAFTLIYVVLSVGCNHL